MYELVLFFPQFYFCGKYILTLKKYQGPEAKCKELKKCYRDPDSKRQYQKRKYRENHEQEKEYEKRYMRKILNKKENMKKSKYPDNPH